MVKPTNNNVMILSNSEKRLQNLRPSSPAEKRRLHAFIAALNDDLPALSRHLRKDEVNQQDMFGNTALAFAVMQDNLATVKTLLHMGANPYLASPRNHHSPMTIAQTLKLDEIVRYMQAYWVHRHPVTGDTSSRKGMPALEE